MRSAIVGCGAIGKVHAAAVRHTGADLAAVCDVIRSRAQELSEGATVYDSFDMMLEREQLDFIHICTPHYLHLEMAEKALAKGINVLLEKPPAMTEAQFEELLSAKKNSGARLCVCFQNRINPSTVLARKMIESGEYGALKGMSGIVTWDRRGEYYTESGWRGRKATEGGSVLINQAIHTLDLITLFLGEPTGVRSIASNFSHGEIDTEDTVCAEMDFNGRRAVLYATNCCAATVPAELTLFFEQAAVSIDVSGLIVRRRHQPPEFIPAEQTAPGKSCWGNSHSELISRFYAGEDVVPLESCKNTMRLLFAIYSGGLKQAERKEF